MDFPTISIGSISASPGATPNVGGACAVHLKPLPKKNLVRKTKPNVSARVTARGGEKLPDLEERPEKEEEGLLTGEGEAGAAGRASGAARVAGVGGSAGGAPASSRGGDGESRRGGERTMMGKGGRSQSQRRERLTDYDGLLLAAMGFLNRRTE